MWISVIMSKVFFFLSYSIGFVSKHALVWNDIETGVLRLWIRGMFSKRLHFTFKIGALLPPVDTKATQRAAFTTGKVIVTRCGGALGESLMGATIFFVSCIWGSPKPNHLSCVMYTVAQKVPKWEPQTKTIVRLSNMILYEGEYHTDL